MNRINIANAVPGSGKTTLIVDSIEWAINNGDVPATSILALTFANSMALEMKERVNDRGLTIPDIKTLHSFCNALIKENPSRYGYEDAPTVLTEYDQNS